MITLPNHPGLTAKLAAADLPVTEHEDHEGNKTLRCPDDAAAQVIIDGYTVAEAINYRKARVDELEADKFDQGLTLVYGFIPPAAKMAKWATKEVEAKAWQAWDDGDRVGDEPAIPTIDGEVTVTRTRKDMVAKVSVNAAALESMRAAIETRAQDIKEELAACTDFAAVAAVDINVGWPV